MSYAIRLKLSYFAYIIYFILHQYKYVVKQLT